MNTLIVPCAGKSTRFPNMKPKWLLTHPDGKIMLEKALEGLNLAVFDRIIITIVKEFDEKYEAQHILKQVFNDPKIQICILDNFTKSASETVYMTIIKENITGSVVIKDSDNCVYVDIPRHITNSIVGLDLHKTPTISNIPGKSFLIVNEQNVIQDIIEKKIVSNIICLGVYAFENINDFKSAYQKLVANQIDTELFISHVISYILSLRNCIFSYIEAKGYSDWGTLAEWREVQKAHGTFFIDVDGVILKNSGRFGKVNWSNNTECIKQNVETIKEMQQNGAQIIITTSRTEEYRTNLEKILNELGIQPHSIIMGLNHASRIIINDFAATNPYPSCSAISLPRNTLIKDYI